MSEVKTYVQVEDGVVTNIVLADLEFAFASGLKSAPEGVGIGWRYNGQPDDFTAPSVAAAPRQIPQQVSRFQARAALYQAGLLDEIEAYIARDDTDFLVKLAWKDAQDFRRDSPMIEAVRILFSLTVEQMDDLFIFANTVRA